MPETVYEKHYRDRLESARGIASAPGPDTGTAALFRRFYTDLRTLFADLAAAYRDLLRKEHSRIFQVPGVTVAWLRERRSVLQELGEVYLRLAGSVRSDAYQAWEAAGKPDGDTLNGYLDAEARAVQEARQDVLRHWPVGGDEDLTEGRAAAARGEGLDADEAFAQIAGTDVPGWRKRIDEYGKNHP
jgi:hypothetical protein